MPRVKPIEIYYKLAKRKRILHPVEDVQIAGDMIIIIHPEYRSVPMKSNLFGKKKMGTQQANIPVEAIPVADIEKIDFGYLDPIAYKEAVARAKKEEEAKKPIVPGDGVVGAKEEKLRPGETFPGEFKQIAKVLKPSEENDGKEEEKEKE